MNVLYAIATPAKGIGGHYYSYKTTLEAMSDDAPVMVNFEIKGESPIFDNIEGIKYKIDITLLSLISSIKKLYEICKLHQIDLIHSFDKQSFLFVSILNMFYKIPNVYTICGGPIPRGYFPKMQNLVLFSQEHMEYFNMNREKFNIQDLYFIPNRVTPFKTNEIKINELKKKYNLQEKNTILRISRISVYYEKSLLQSIDFVNKLNENNLNIKLLIVGQPSDADVYEKLVQLSGDTVYIETENKFYENAKEIVGIGSFGIATGRTVMEAFSKGVLTLTPLSNRKYPILLDEDSFDVCFRTNFSERNSSVLMEDNIINKFLEIYNDEKKMIQLKDFYHLKYQKYFDFEHAKNKYKEVYEKALNKTYRVSMYDFIMSFISISILVTSHTTFLTKKNIKKIFKWN